MSAGRHPTILDVLYEAPGPHAKRRQTIATIISCIALAALAFLVVRRFYVSGQLGQRYWALFTRYTTWRFLWRGLASTLFVAIAAGIITFAMAFILMLGRLSDWKSVRLISTIWIDFTRGTPTLLFIYFFLLFVPPPIGFKLPSFWKITLPVAISASGVVSEMLRSGVNAVERGQREAALSLGMRKYRIFFKIIFPQAFRFVIPSLIAEIIIVLKDTTFAYIVNYADLMQNARVLMSNHDALLSVYLVVAAIYILINYLLGKASSAVAHRSGTPSAK